MTNSGKRIKVLEYVNSSSQQAPWEGLRTIANQYMFSNLEYKIYGRGTASGYIGFTDMGANISNQEESD
ncbi:hypothetical protein llap_6940 [Limosa lapponica baueri]|uniref:Uncharacterized protein n=1 Tax=Limosa lapponica baueri TaxID=1758121 RepID=A0A2I0U9M8_LIMLA|nr:hypothetical protein llap_6940 [Limosa lapponica baueri]